MSRRSIIFLFVLLIIILLICLNNSVTLVRIIDNQQTCEKNEDLEHQLKAERAENVAYRLARTIADDQMKKQNAATEQIVGLIRHYEKWECGGWDAHTEDWICYRTESGECDINYWAESTPIINYVDPNNVRHDPTY